MRTLPPGDTPAVFPLGVGMKPLSERDENWRKSLAKVS